MLNFNFYSFEPPQPIFGHFLGALASSSHCYYFLVFFCFFGPNIFFYYFLEEKNKFRE